MSAFDDLFANATDREHASKVAGPLSEMLGGGGAHELLGKLSSGGLADAVKSWVGTGPTKLPVSADQIKNALGSGPLAELAAKAGISSDQVSSALATLLPHAIDHMTPDGKPPTPESKGPDAGAFAKLFAPR